MANIENSGEMLHNAAFHQGLIKKVITQDRNTLFYESLTGNPLKYKIVSFRLIVSVFISYLLY